MSAPEKLYFKGNAAKSRVMGLILAHSAGRGKRLIFDYGCGQAIYWSKVLGDHPGLSLVFFDPNPESMAQAKANLAGKPARPLDDPFVEPPLSADFVVSFSVFEHARDRKGYLAQAFRHLKPGGLLFLNYDDGHFRNTFSLNHPLSSLDQLKEMLFNLTARPLALAGYLSHYQRRVVRRKIDRLIKETGFEIQEVFYSNMPSLKGFYGELEDRGWDEAARAEYAAKWQELEAFLNEKMLRDEDKERMGDRANLWPHMLSRTLVLKKPGGKG